MRETRWPRRRWEFKYSTQCSPTRPIRRRFSFAEAAELGGRIRMKRGGGRKTDDERDGTKGPSVRVGLMERNWNHLPGDKHGTSSSSSSPVSRLGSPVADNTRVSFSPYVRIIEILERKKGIHGVDRTGEQRKKRRLQRRIALLMEPWLSVGPSYNVHYIYLPGSVVLPECRPEGPPPAEHKAVKRFNSIRAAERRVGSNGGFIEFNASVGSALWKSPARITLPQHFNAPRALFAFTPPPSEFHRVPFSIALDNVRPRRDVPTNLPWQHASRNFAWSTRNKLSEFERGLVRRGKNYILTCRIENRLSTAHTHVCIAQEQ